MPSRASPLTSNSSPPNSRSRGSKTGTARSAASTLLFRGTDGLIGMFREMLAAYSAELHFSDPAADAGRIAGKVEALLLETAGGRLPDALEMITAVFYRDKAAYIIGRMRIGDRIQPLVVAFLSKPGGGCAADAVLMAESDISILFSFTRSYFHVAADNPMELINFLKTLMPLKRVSEIYTSIGFHKHGKSELYRELTRSLETSSDQFEIARGEKGMVMLVFTLPSFDVVFKVIKDRFEFPKSTNSRRSATATNSCSGTTGPGVWWMPRNSRTWPSIPHASPRHC